MRAAVNSVADVTTATIIKTDEQFLCETADRIRQRMTRTAQDIVEIGRELIAVKDRVGHGNFLPSEILGRAGLPGRPSCTPRPPAAEDLGARGGSRSIYPVSRTPPGHACCG